MTVIRGRRRLSGDGLQCHSVMFRVQHTFTAGKIFNVKIQLMKSVTVQCAVYKYEVICSPRFWDVSCD